MNEHGLGKVEQPEGKEELERLKDEYRRKNKALDAEREALEDAVRERRYSPEYAEEYSRRLEENGRAVLDEVQGRIDAHCIEYGLRDNSFSATWAAEE
ncbi:hypothetical protein ABZ957_03395 [Streptomyces sp. NPDC046316]|uniref:hypothetical protein n=1 Tax=Streptomyces sp. NPDC046316 TaxID=3154494 RepID=UPI0033E74381